MSTEPSLPALPPDDRGNALVTNASALVVARVVVAGLGWAGTIFIVRALSPEAWGQFSFVFNLLGMLAFVTELGASRIVLSELSRDSADRGAFAGSYVMLRLVLGVVAYLCAVAFVVIAGYPAPVVEATAIAGVISVIASFSSGLDVVFQASLRMGIVAMGSVLGQIVQLGATVLIALTRPTLLLFVLPAVLYDIVAAAYKLRYVGRIVPLRYRFDVTHWRFILNQAAPLTLIGLLASVSGRLDIIVLSWLDSFEAVGFYNVAIKFSTIVVFIPGALAAPLLTLLVRAWPDHRAEFAAALRHGLSLLVISAGLVLVGFLPVAANLVTLLYGRTYADAALAAQLSVVAVCLSFVGFLASGLFVAQERYRDYLVVMATGLVLSIVGNVALVRAFSYTGAALAHVLREAALLVLIGVIVLRQPALPHLQMGRQLRVAAATAAGLAVGFGLVRVAPWPVAMAAAVGGYVLLLELTKAAGPEGLRGALADLRRSAAATDPGGT